MEDNVDADSSDVGNSTDVDDTYAEEEDVEEEASLGKKRRRLPSPEYDGHFAEYDAHRRRGCCWYRQTCFLFHGSVCSLSTDCYCILSGYVISTCFHKPCFHSQV